MTLKYYFSKISYGNNTSCIECTNLKLIQHHLIDLLKQQNYRFISRPYLDDNSDFLMQELLSSPYKTEPYLWAIGLSASNSGWTTIKTSVQDLLCRNQTNSNNWLSQLSMRLKCNAFHHHVDRRHWGVLLETNAMGRTLVTGIPLEIEDPEDMKFYGLSVNKPKRNRNFLLLDLPETFQQAGKTTKTIGENEKQKRNIDLEQLFLYGANEAKAKAVAEWQKLNMGGRESFDRDLGNLICESESFWQEDNIFYRAYSKANKLKQNRIKLMFYQVGRFDLDPKTRKIWSPIENFDWTNYIADLKKVNLKSL